IGRRAARWLVTGSPLRVVAVVIREPRCRGSAATVVGVCGDTAADARHRASRGEGRGGRGERGRREADREGKRKQRRGVSPRTEAHAQSPTVKVAVTTSVPPALLSIAAVIVCEPLAMVVVLVGLAVPLAAVPAKSQGPAPSVWRGVPLICGLSSQKRTRVTPLAGEVNT